MTGSSLGEACSSICQFDLIERAWLGRLLREWFFHAVEALVGPSVDAALQVETGFGDAALSYFTELVQQEGTGPAGEVGLGLSPPSAGVASY